MNHYEICQAQGFIIVAEVTIPWKRKRKEKQLKYYYELIEYIKNNRNVTIEECFWHFVHHKNKKLKILNTLSNYNKIVDLAKTCKTAGLILPDAILDFNVTQKQSHKKI